MKTLEDLKKMRDEMSKKISLRENKNGLRVVVGMATCGITAGARPILTTILEEVSKNNLTDVTVSQVGCIGECALEPIVEVYDAEGKRTTYAKVTKDVARKIVQSHIMNHEVVMSNLIQSFK
ncbi:MAG TPA: (2Fe-2S) ferredoxin domain-containing protein [Bacilli bacterium]|nr:(2Fe-2S) ferredoxin domain-containing protein [Bacilli bacterium]